MISTLDHDGARTEKKSKNIVLTTPPLGLTLYRGLVRGFPKIPGRETGRVGLQLHANLEIGEKLGGKLSQNAVHSPTVG